MESTPPTPLPGGETHEELPHTFVLLDTTQSPQPVLQLGNQPTAGSVPAPAGQAWVDMTGVTPAPQVGWLYDGTNWAPGLAEQLSNQMAQAMENNAIYLARGQSGAQQQAQIAALTDQVSVLIQQVFRLPPPPPPGAAPPAVAQFTYTPAAPNRNATVTFDATASSGDGALSYAWTFTGSGGPAIEVSTVLTVIELPTLEVLRDEQRSLRAQLARLRGRLHRQLALEFAADAALVITGTAAMLVLLDWWFRFGLPSRLFLLTLARRGGCGVSGRAARQGAGVRRGFDELSLAVILDRYRPGVGQQIADVLQLPGLLDEPRATASPAMVRLAVRRACAALAGSDWRTLWNRKRTALHAAALAGGLLVPVAVRMVGAAGRSLEPRAVAPGLDRALAAADLPHRDGAGRARPARWPRATSGSRMEVRTDLPLIEPRGDRGSSRAGASRWSCARSPSGRGSPKRSVVRETNRRAHGPCRDDGRSGCHSIPLRVPAVVRLVDLRADRRRRLARTDRPGARRPPVAGRDQAARPGAGASYQGFRDVDDPRQHLLFLPDTEVELTLVGSEPLADARLKVHPGSPPELRRIDERTFAARWTLREATTLEIVLTSARTGLTSKPTFLSIGLLKDREPRVTLRAVGVGGHVTPVATIPLTVAATDDFGLAALRLQSRADDERRGEREDRAEDAARDGRPAAGRRPGAAGPRPPGPARRCPAGRPAHGRDRPPVRRPRPRTAAPEVPRSAGRACSTSRSSRPTSSSTRS